MHPGKVHVAPAVLIACLTLSCFIGCGTTSANPPAPSLPSTPTTAANSVAAGAVLGYAWDSTAAGLRPILGVPGAAQFGSPVYGGVTYNNARACPDQKYALLTNSSGQASLAPLPSGVPVPIADHLSAKEQIAISPSCSAALLYAPGTPNATLVLGLPASPKAKSLDLSQAGAVASAVVSDSGLVLVASGQSASGINVEAVSSDGSAMQVTAVAGLAGMAFLPSSQNALIGDAGRSTIWLASNLPASTSLSRVATNSDGVEQPTAIASSFDGRWLIIANQNGASILRVDLTNQSAPAQVACSCTATKLARLNGNNTFLLSDLGTGPSWTFDGDSPSPRVLFIPAVKSSTTAGVAR